MIPTDKEMLQIVRTRLVVVEDAAEAFLKVMKATGEEREAAYAKQKQGAPVEWVGNVSAFLTVYENTMPPRMAAIRALVEALVMDFRTALICDPGTTEEILARWIPLCEKPDTKVETTS